MYYYQFHIGDYRAATSHLNNEEDLAYRRLLDMYYDTESCIPLDTQWVSRRIRIAHDVVLSVLIDMFQKTESGWFHPVCDRNLKQYIAKAETARTNGKSGGRPKKNPVGSQQEPDGKLTNNHKPITNNQVKTISSADADFERFWKVWPSTQRKVAKAKCLDIWKRRKLSELGEKIVAHVTVMKTTKQWLDGYEPAPLTYLNQSRWEDGLPVGGSGVTSNAMPDWAPKRATSA